MEERPARNLKKPLIVALLVLVVVLVAGAAGVFGNSYVNRDKVMRGTVLAGVDIGRMSRDQALSALEALVLPALERPVELSCMEQTFSYSREALGADVVDLEGAVDQTLAYGRQIGAWRRALIELGQDIPAEEVQLQVRVEMSKLADILYKLVAEVQRPPKDAQVDVAGNSVVVHEGQVGLSVDLQKALLTVSAALQNPMATRIELPYDELKPSITSEDVASFDTVLGTYTTRFRPSEVGRTHNLRLASSKVDNSLVRVGDTFSLNSRRGPSTADAGYREAFVYREGRVEPELGGGICQVASTLYNAVVLAGLDIVERGNHMFTVDYVPMGMDATVYYGGRDFKFNNDLTHPVLLKMRIEGNQLSAWVIGNSGDRRDVNIERWGATTTPFQVVEKPDPTLPAGKRVTDQKGHSGHSINVKITVSKNGEVIHQTTRKDTYRVGNKIILVGTGGAAKPPAPDAPVPEEEVSEELVTP